MTASSAPQIPDDLLPYLDTIADRLLSGHAAVMVGSGFSKNAISSRSDLGFPDWSELGDRFYESLHGNPPGATERYLQVPALAHQVEAAFDRPALNQMLQDAIPDLQYEPSQLHKALLDLPWSDVFTTNYDTLLERACRSVVSQRYDVVRKPDDLGHSNRPRIVKLHGSLQSDNRFTITDEDYRRYPNEFAPFVNAVQQTLLENTLCLIGFSGDDPNFLQWIGWIHDNLGHRNSPQMYLVGLLQLSPAQRKLLESRNITPVDMSVCPEVGRDHYRALDQFLGYLQYRRVAENHLDWPRTGDERPSPDRKELVKVVEAWAAQRRKYPGWIVLSEDLRASLWSETSKWVGELHSASSLPAVLDLEFAFELVWRMEKCLCPIIENQVSLLEATIDRYWPATNEDASLESLAVKGIGANARGLTLDHIRNRCHYLMLVMLRCYRVDGLSSEWDVTHERIQSVLETLSPEHLARFHYERSLFALFALNPEQLKDRLGEWPRNDALPFWAAKKAGLLAEIGLVTEARQILEQSLEAIRVKLNLTPTKADYTLVSQESFVMYLLQAVGWASVPRGSEWSDIYQEHRELRERWHVLKQYKCDPWRELESFQDKLQRPFVTTPNFLETPTFDIGRSQRTQHIQHWDNATFTAYNFLLFCEDAGIPLRVSNFLITAKTAAGALERIAQGSSHWALATLVRIGDVKVVGEIFNRASLTHLNTSSVDRLIGQYLEALSVATIDIRSGDRWTRSNFGTQLAGVLPEILSRLCCKCSKDARETLLDWLLEIYRSEHRSNYRGIRSVTERLLSAVPIPERNSILPKLLQFPILSEIDLRDQQEYRNPFDYIDLYEEMIPGNTPIFDMELEVFFDGALSDNPARRIWAISTLGTLQSGGLLEPTGVRRFADCLWSQVDDCGLPRYTNYYRFAFLSMAHPNDVDPVECFRVYIRDMQLPAEKSETHTIIQSNGIDDFCRNVCGATDIQWTDEDVRSIVRRLAQSLDDAHVQWLLIQGREVFSLQVRILEDRMSQLITTLATVVSVYPDSVRDRSTQDVLTRVAEECSRRCIPALRLDVASTYVFADSRESVLERVTAALESTHEGTVNDAINSMILISRRTKSQTEGQDLQALLRVAVQIIRWRCKTSLATTINALEEVVTKHSWIFVDEIESAVLAGLRHLATESDLAPASGDGIRMSGDLEDMSRRVLLRQLAARLSYKLFKQYRKVADVVPEEIATWEAICQSEDEFWEIRNEWIAP